MNGYVPVAHGSNHWALVNWDRPPWEGRWPAQVDGRPTRGRGTPCCRRLLVARRSGTPCCRRLVVLVPHGRPLVALVPRGRHLVLLGRRGARHRPRPRMAVGVAGPSPPRQCLRRRLLILLSGGCRVERVKMPLPSPRHFVEFLQLQRCKMNLEVLIKRWKMNET